MEPVAAGTLYCLSSPVGQRVALQQLPAQVESSPGAAQWPQSGSLAGGHMLGPENGESGSADLSLQMFLWLVRHLMPEGGLLLGLHQGAQMAGRGEGGRGCFLEGLGPATNFGGDLFPPPCEICLLGQGMAALCSCEACCGSCRGWSFPQMAGRLGCYAAEQPDLCSLAKEAPVWLTPLQSLHSAQVYLAEHEPSAVLLGSLQPALGALFSLCCFTKQNVSSLR